MGRAGCRKKAKCILEVGEAGQESSDFFMTFLKLTEILRSWAFFFLQFGKIGKGAEIIPPVNVYVCLLVTWPH